MYIEGEGLVSFKTIFFHITQEFWFESFTITKNMCDLLFEIFHRLILDAFETYARFLEVWAAF